MTGHMNITADLAHTRRVELIRQAERARMVRAAVHVEQEAVPHTDAPRRVRLSWLLPSRHATA